MNVKTLYNILIGGKIMDKEEQVLAGLRNLFKKEMSWIWQLELS